MYDVDLFQKNKKRTSSIALRFGIFGGALMWGVHLIMLLLFGGTNQGDFLAWVIEWVVYYFIGRSAAYAQFNAQRDSAYASRGVKAAGTGAALITSLLVWLFILVRGIVRDAYGIIVLVDPIGLFLMIVIDISLAMGIGSWAGQSVLNKHKNFDSML